VRLDPQGLDLRQVPMPGGNASADALLNDALYNMRCIEWENISQTLMAGRICGPDAAVCMEWYSQSRPLKPGETIDFFLSHSWHDDAVAKFRKLQLVADTFHNKYGRFPTFWLDKVCIDQSRINDCLKVLPVNVMACSKVLIFLGDTYPERLWCAWELFILFAFARPEQAAERALVVPLSPDSDAHDRLESFDSLKAHCFDPNEELRLRRVITAVSADNFNNRIRTWAAKVRKRPHVMGKSISFR